MAFDAKGQELIFEIDDWLENRAAEYQDKMSEYEERMEDDNNLFLDFDMDEETDEYLSDVFDYLSQQLPELIALGRGSAAFSLVVDAFTEFDLDDCGMQGDDIYDYMMDLLELIVSKTDDLHKRIEFFLDIKERLYDGDIPETLTMTIQDVLHDLFDDKEILEILARIYIEQFEIVDDSDTPFIKGRMRDVVERMGWPKEFTKELNDMEVYDDGLHYLLYADCLARRGDMKVLDVWNNILRKTRKGTEEFDHVEDYIKYRRMLFLDKYGNDEEKKKSYEDYMDDDFPESEE